MASASVHQTNSTQVMQMLQVHESVHRRIIAHLLCYTILSAQIIWYISQRWSRINDGLTLDYNQAGNFFSHFDEMQLLFTDH